MNLFFRVWVGLAFAASALLPLAATVRAAPILPPINAAAPGPLIPGSFVWFDLVTDDIPASRAFYGAVFGWTFRSLGEGTAAYTAIQLGQRDIGGMLVPAGERPARARWLSLISVADPAAAARQVERSGGKVLVPPMAVPQRGTHALLADPEGAVFGVVRSSTGDPADAVVPDGDFFWVDLFSRDPAAEATFYRDLVGYQVSQAELEGTSSSRLVLSSGGFARAGVAPLPRPDLQPAWLPYVLVADVPATLERATRAGGRVLLAPRPELLDGQLAVIADPRGGVIGVINWRDSDQPQGAAK